MSKVILFFVLLIAGIAHSQVVNITFYNEKHWTSSSGADQYEADKLATSFSTKGNSAPVYVSLDFVDPSAISAKSRLSLAVYKVKNGAEEYAFSQDMLIPKKKGSLKIKSNFTPGEYVARIFDKDNEASVFGSGTFSVGVASKPDYKNTSMMVACASVNDNWEAVNETKKIKAGSCTSILYKASKSLPPLTHYSMIWSIVRVKLDGTEEFVNDLNQMVENGEKGWRFLSTDNLCEFARAGTYHIYLFDKETSDAHHGVSDEYYGKMELLVE